MKSMVLLILSLVSSVCLIAQNRYALVVGNGSYQDNSLRNAVNDATDISSALRSIGFQVIFKSNINKRTFETEVNKFSNQLKNDDIALFYYSGHGAQVEDENYLIPVNENIVSETDCKYSAVNANWVLDKINHAKTIIFILDACRDNPFRGLRSGNRGMVPMHATTGEAYIVYATAPGKTAADGQGRNSPFTKSLIKNIQEPNIRIEDVIKNVRKEVMAETGNKQVPWSSSNLIGEFYFKYLNDGELVTNKESKKNKIQSTISRAQPKQEYQQDYPQTVTDIDGNVYKTVKIGNQVWMAENLKVTRYRNGDPIPYVTDNSQWANLSSGAYCNYDNNTSYAAKYGRLYNWSAVKDRRGLAPAGWRVPTDADWQKLIDYLGGESVAGDKLKEAGITYWKSPNTTANNASGFTALPGGYRHYGNGTFDLIGLSAYWWSSTEYSSASPWYRLLSYSPSAVFRLYSRTQYGFSVRCVRD